MYPKPNIARPWFTPSRPAQIFPIPWLAPEVINVLSGLIQPSVFVVEHGSGGSTLWFASRVARVLSIEDDSDWFQAVKAQAPGNVTLILGRRIPILDAPADLILIDGEPIEDRAQWIKQAPLMVRPGGYIILDNYNRPEYAAERNELAEKQDCIWRTMHSPAGTDYCMTEIYKVA